MKHDTLYHHPEDFEIEEAPTVAQAACRVAVLTALTGISCGLWYLVCIVGRTIWKLLG